MNPPVKSRPCLDPAVRAPRARLGDWRVLALAMAGMLSPHLLPAASLVRPGDTVAICGDSITEQRLYSVFIEDYLLMCQGAQPVRPMQFGWGGESLWHFADRVDNAVLRFRPSVVTMLYGVNDGAYRARSPKTEKEFRMKAGEIVRKLKQNGVRDVLFASPIVVDTATYDAVRSQPIADKQVADSKVFNETLRQLGEIGREVAAQEKITFVDLHSVMQAAMAKAKAKYGAAYAVAGSDGVHPNRNGQLIIAYAFLKAMGFDGDIGTLTLDAATGKAEASEGHRIIRSTPASLEVESTRYPFCFAGDPASPDATSGIIEFLPFNEDLNRLVLRVKNLSAPRVRITWGGASREFSAAELGKGVNLAAEFLDNPFSAAFGKVEECVRRQQEFEVPFLKMFVENYPAYLEAFSGARESLAATLQKVAEQHDALSAAARAARQPVTHTIRITPLSS